MRARFLALGLCLLLGACGGGGNARPGEARRPAAPGEVVTEEFMIASATKELEVYIRNKHRNDLYDVKPEKAVLFLHGASYPGHSSFDLAIEGASWMDWLARRGYDVYSLDLLGYGKSNRHPAMDQPPEANPPIEPTQWAVEDLTRAVEFVLSRRNLPRLVLVGWSWGASVAGSYAVQVPGKVDRVVLYAPQWLREDRQAPADVDPAKIGAWRAVDPRGARDAWLRAVPEAKREAVLPKSTFDAWVKATLASDPDGAAKGSVRAPNGVVADALKTWGAGKPLWSPGKLSVPVMIVEGEWDTEAPPAMGLALFAQLEHAPVRRHVMIGEATHALLLEKNRQQLYRVVQGFLEEPVQ